MTVDLTPEAVEPLADMSEAWGRMQIAKGFVVQGQNSIDLANAIRSLLAALATARADALREAANVADYAGAIQDQRDGSYAGSVAVMGRDVGDLIRALAQEQTNDR
jgi:hypothetical protein